MIKTLSKLGIEGKYLNLMKNFYRTPIVCIILNAENLDVFLLDHDQGKVVLSHPSF